MLDLSAVLTALYSAGGRKWRVLSAWTVLGPVARRYVGEEVKGVVKDSLPLVAEKECDS